MPDFCVVFTLSKIPVMGNTLLKQISYSFIAVSVSVTAVNLLFGDPVFPKGVVRFLTVCFIAAVVAGYTNNRISAKMPENKEPE